MSQVTRLLISNSLDVYWNLALENLLFLRQQRLMKKLTASLKTPKDAKSSKLSIQQKDTVLLVYRNSPSVVIGIHQNPWLECRVRDCQIGCVDIARRKSGGGAVYHDLGNWNVSVVSPNAYSQRLHNAKFVQRICDRLRTEVGPVRLGDRHDLFLGDKKVCGSASKLSGRSSYHHFCILCSANLSRLSSLLKPSLPSIETNATQSVRSPVTNLCNWQLQQQLPDLVAAVITDEAAHNWKLLPGDLRVLDDNEASLKELGLSTGELAESATELRSWAWVFGRTPKFFVTLDGPCRLRLRVESGRIAEIEAADEASEFAERVAQRLRPLLLHQACRASALLPHLNCLQAEGSLDSGVLQQLTKAFQQFGY